MVEAITSFFSRFAASCTPTGGGFFGLKPWYAYLDGETDSLGRCVPQLGNSGQGIWLVVLAIIDSLLRIASLVAVGFIIYGGIQYVISQGEPDKTNQAKNTIINALVGLVISIAAASIVSFVGQRVG